MSALQKLLFHIGVSDKGSAKILRFQKSVDRTCRQVRANFEGIKAGALSAAGAGASIYQLVNPAVDFNRAMGEVRSLGTAEEAMAALQTSAKQFALQYGGSAAEVVRSSYDIQSAIAGLKGRELGTFTVVSATLAKGVKADAATITDYVGTMYGVWESQANKMGKATWIEQLAGKTALAVNMFKTNGNKWAEGVSALGASATAKGLGMEEQFAVLGNLQMTTGGGSESATKYNAFLSGVLGAQQKLGLKFFKDGKMLGAADIIDKIKAKFGGKWSENAMKSVKEAFGSDEAVKFIELLLGKTDKLRQDMKSLGAINNMDPAKKMAKAQSDVWARLGSTWDVIRITFAQRMLPAIEKVAEGIRRFLAYIQKCMDIAPGLTGKLGLIIVSAITLAGVMGVLVLAVTVSKLAFLGWKIAGGSLLKILKLLTLGNLKLAAAMLANPITWIVIGVLALIAGVAALIYYWSDLVAWFKNTSWGQALFGVCRDIGQWWDGLTQKFADIQWAQGLRRLGEMLMTPLRGLGNAAQGLFQNVRQWWGNLTGALADSSWGQGLLGLLDTVLVPLRGIGSAALGMFQNLLQGWAKVMGAFANGDWAQGLRALGDLILAPWRGLGNAVMGLFQNIRQWWAGLTASFADSSWAQGLLGLLDTVLVPLRGIGSAVLGVFQNLLQGWANVMGAFANGDWAQGLAALEDLILAPWRGLGNAVMGLFRNIRQWWAGLTASFADSGWAQGLFGLPDMILAPFRGLGDAVMGLFQNIRQWWAGLTASFADGSWTQGLLGLFDVVLAPLRGLGDAVMGLFQNIRQWWTDLTGAFMDSSWAQALSKSLDLVLSPLRGLGKGLSWVGEKLGIVSAEPPKVRPSDVPALDAPRQTRTVPGGVTSQITNTATNQGRTVTIGSITVQPQTMPTLEDIEALGYVS